MSAESQKSGVIQQEELVIREMNSSIQTYSQEYALTMDFLELMRFGSQLSWDSLPCTLSELIATGISKPITGGNIQKHKQKNG